MRDECDYSDLHYTVLLKTGKVDKVQAILESDDGRGMLDKAQSDKRTALQLAVRENHVPVVKKLVDAGANVNFRSSNDGRSALHIAAGKGNNTIVNLLLEAGADKDAKRGLPPTFSFGGNDKTPLWWRQSRMDTSPWCKHYFPRAPTSIIFNTIAQRIT